MCLYNYIFFFFSVCPTYIIIYSFKIKETYNSRSCSYVIVWIPFKIIHNKPIWFKTISIVDILICIFFYTISKNVWYYFVWSVLMMLCVLIIFDISIIVIHIWILVIIDEEVMSFHLNSHMSKNSSIINKSNNYIDSKTSSSKYTDEMDG